MKSVKRLLTRKNPKKETEESKTEQPTEEAEPKQETEEQMAEPTSNPPEQDAAGCKIYIVFYTMYGHVYKMAEAVKKGIDSVEGCQATLYQVISFLGTSILTNS